MKSYLQRLAARAEGVGTTTPSLIPTVRNEAISHSDDVSAFAEVDGVVGSPSTPKNPPGASTLIEPPGRAEFVPSLPSKGRARQITLRADRGEIIEETGIAENTSARPGMPSRELAASPTVLPPETKSNEQSSDRSFPGTNHPASTLLIPRELNLDANRIPKPATKASGELTNDKPTAPFTASMEPVALLEPRLMGVPPPPVSIPDEPRLVIGQMRVDVVATAAPQTREVVRVVTRMDGSNNRSHVGSSISKLRFGLGQM